VTDYDLVFWGEMPMSDQVIHEMMKGDTMEKELEIKEDVPGAEAVPGLGLGEVLKYAGLLEKIIPILLAGEGEFDFKFKGVRKHIAITNLT
jgi:hypothetical protein